MCYYMCFDKDIKREIFLIWCFVEVKIIFGFCINCFVLLLELKVVNYVLEICIYLLSGL